ncbi:MAG: YicC family protein [Halieaceae bacterium]|jgi:uncharacterized protein (TIGR00255 family)|nr:YicC family protein [Halieaceae bacterium]
MIHSMTAFARESLVTDQGILTLELRSVNHRYFDCIFKLPDTLRSLEPKFRELINARLARGKVDCQARLQPNPKVATELKLHQVQLEKLLKTTAHIVESLPQARPLSPMEVLQYPGICSADEPSSEQLQLDAVALFDTALSTLIDNRQREGEKLAAMVRGRLHLVQEEVTTTRTLLPELMLRQRQKIIGRIADLGIDIDQNRLEQELVYAAQKADVDEELDRLETHIQEVQRTLDKGGPCGRRLDFLMQELNREANTLSSKSTASSTTQNAVELKVLIEQMREQIQNIE